MEIGIVLIIALVVFGPKKLPELGRSLGKGLREFKGTISGESETTDEKQPEIAQAVTTTPAKAPHVDATVKQV
jgi:sec-independent protein translocase protein TatA